MSEARLPLDGLDAIVLVGGRGTRLGSLAANCPKPLVPVLGRPFLFYLLDLLALRGARSVVLACGHMAEKVREAVPASWLGMPVRFSIETEPLGTGGAVRAAAELASSPLVAVLNGDSWHDPDWAAMAAAAASSPGVLALSRRQDASAFGTACLEAGRVKRFLEKQPGAGWVNAGVYVFQRSWLVGFEPGSRSLERDMLPALAEGGGLAGILSGSDFYDMGTPEALEQAGPWIEKLGIAPHSMFPDFPNPADARIKLGACAVVREPGTGRVLLERRTDCGWWCVPGGRVEPGETLAAAALREAEEETGLRLALTWFLGVFSDPARRIVRYPDNGDLRHLVDVVVLAEPVAGAPRAGPESLELGWFPPGKLPLNTLPPVIEILREALGGGGPGLLR
ncbi:MAG: sugar phosphate nucleotidyltransferase [Terrimicrobiaceae bacterium]|nr:sugar phosphate nucleotidyltransferase [Terrimicrobiaceae bacterium]